MTSFFVARQLQTEQARENSQDQAKSKDAIPTPLAVQLGSSEWIEIKM